jgi:uncharacterized protein
MQVTYKTPVFRSFSVKCFKPIFGERKLITVLDIVNNKKEYRFEIGFEDGGIAVLTYRWLKGSMVLMHTVVPVAHRMQGTGAKLVKYVLDYARAQNLKIIVYCPFVAKYMKEHPAWDDLLLKPVNP